MGFTQRYLRLLNSGESSNIFIYAGSDSLATIMAAKDGSGVTYFNDAQENLRQGDWILDFPPAGTSFGAFCVSSSSAAGVIVVLAGTSSPWA